ncbi:MAG: ACP phosphodiesterase [Flavobacteriales bacterium]
MNFLGHLYFSNNDHELMYANLFGDHIKGSQLDKFPSSVKKGILLHRKIDYFIDHHPAVIGLLHMLYHELPKVAGIAVDLYFDHLLAVNWNKYHTKDLDEFLVEFYTYVPNNWNHYSKDFQILIGNMRKFRCMNYYAKFEGLEKDSEGVSSRISFDNTLKDAPAIFLKHRTEIESSFSAFMKDAIPMFEKLNLEKD